MTAIIPDALEDDLFLAMLDFSRKGAGPEFDLVTICGEVGIEATPRQLLAFTSDNDGGRGKKNNTLDSIRFTLSAEGRRHALTLEDKRRPRTFKDRVIAISRSDWIALGALIVSAIALLKD